MKKLRNFCDEIEDLLFGNEIFQTPHPRRRRDPRRRSPCSTACPAPTCAPAASTGTCAATRRCRWPGTRSTSRCGPTPTATASPAAGCACRRPARPPRSSTSCSTASPPGRSWPRCRASSRCPRARPGSATENPLGEMGYYVVSKGDLGPFRVKIRTRQLQQHLDRAVGAARRLRARRHHHPRQPLLHPRRHRPVSLAGSRPSVLGRSRCCASSAAPWRCCCRPARSSTCSCSR